MRAYGNPSGVFPTMAKETPQFFLNRDGRRLFSVLHAADPTGADLAVVFCAPLFEEKLWSHRVLVNCARFLASRGISSLRFDYFGDGESEGRFEQASVASRIADVNDAVAQCRHLTGATKIYVLGLCYGATIGTSAALANQGIAGAIAWSPVMDGERYAGDLLRIHLTAQMVLHRKIVHDREALVRQIMSDQSVNIEGYEIGKTLYEQMTAMDFLGALRAAGKPVLVTQIAPADRVEAQYAGLATLGNSHVEFQAVREAKFWTQQKSVFPHCEELFARTAQWLCP
jgi:alpha/beta superfamily hydrolase